MGDITIFSKPDTTYLLKTYIEKENNNEKNPDDSRGK